MLKLFISLASVVAAVCAAGSAGPYSPQAGGKIAPLLPEEYAFNFVQHKWNENGFGVSHVATGAWLSSIKDAKLRNDLSTYDWVSDNATIKGDIASSTTTTVFDFGHVAKTGNITNIYINSTGMNRTCTSSELPQAQSQGQLFPANFVQQNGMYAGQETVHGIAVTYLADKWIVTIGDTIVSFYFNENGDWVRFDENSQNLKTSVVTWIYNLNKKATFAPSVFNINSCPSK